MSTESGGDDLPPLKKALLAVSQLKSKIDDLSRGPIAIVGAGMRFPGGVRDLESLWRSLRGGVDAVGPVPPDRWDVDSWYDPNPDAPGKTTVREAGFVDDLASFDAAFFGISPREALELDPAQRLLLVTAWEALEDAAIAPDGLERSPTGVYVGLGLSDYGRRHFLGPDPSRMTAYSGTGTFLSVAAGRISYTLGLQGPAMTVDTACSSSLVAIHLAVEALRLGQIDLALAGGANVICAPEPSVYFSKLGATSADGRCKTFDASADGYGRGEGAAVVALERLADALANGRRILGVIRGTAVNQDGRSNGLTAPNGAAQQAVVRAALANAGLTPADVGYVEAHGTGTPLGDPIEVDALKAVFAGRGGPLHLGSVKTNFGHLETAAGVAGLLKIVAAATHGEFPPHLHLHTMNPRIDLRGTRITVNTQAEPWPGPTRIGGVSGFGLSGTNAHVIVEGPPAPTVVEGGERAAHVIHLSARSEPALRALAAQWSAAVPGHALRDVAYTSVVGRASLPIRLAVVATDPHQAAARLASFGRGEESQGVARAEVRRSTAPQVVFLFTGQGAQHAGMGRRLYETEPAFRAALDRCAAAIDPLLGRSLIEAMFAEGQGLDDTALTQPALFALEVSVVAALRARGLEPDLLLGHSVGEIAAAHVAEVLSLADAARLVVERGRRMSALPRDGSMAAIFADEASVRAAVAPHATWVDVSGINGPTEMVISGRTAEVDAIVAGFEASGVRVRRLTVSHAFHSPAMEPMLDGFEAVARSLTFGPPQIAVVSNLDGADAGVRLMEPGYWRRQVRQAVRFADGVRTALAGGPTVFVEVGPRPVLAAMASRVGEGLAFLGALHPDHDDAEQFAGALGAAWAHGVAFDGAALAGVGAVVALPTTVWQGERYWLEPAAPAAANVLGDAVLEVAWRPRAAEPRPVSGRWAVVGDDALAAALAARGATLVAPEAAERVVYAPAGDDPVEIAWTAATLCRGSARVQFVSDAAARPGTAVLRGVGRTLAAERPSAWGGLVDSDGTSVDAVVDALATDDGEDWVQLRQGVRRVARLRRSVAAFRGEPLELAEGAVLVTGAFGALGRRIASWLADRGARHLVLVGRTGASTAEAAALVAALERKGVTVDVRKADVANARSIGPVVSKIADLIGVVHAAGTSDDARLEELDQARFDAVLGPKVRGARILHDKTLDRSLKFFVVVSSAAGVLGVPGQANYGAANAFLDAFASWRRANGLPATSVAFGPIDGVGMAERAPAVVQAQWAREGVEPLLVDDALAALGQVVNGARPWVVVAPFDWAKWRVGRVGHLADELVASVAPGAQPPVAAVATTSLVAELRAAPAGARRTMVVEAVQLTASRVLGYPAERRIGAKDGFFDAGMDSLMAMELRARLQTAIGADLSATLAFDHPNVEAVAGALLEQLGFGAAPAAAAAAAVRDDAEPVAIVGVACRLPGGVNGPDGLWELIERGGDAITEVPPDRYDVNRYYDPTPGTPGRTYSRFGGFVDGLQDFEPAFFGISPREANSLDPQQRLLLECTWHALEDAGIAPDSLADTRTGAYVGIGPSEYWHRFDPTVDEVDAYAATGNETSFAAGRVSYVLGLQGPSMAVNTACSSSLVTVHLAVRALREGACDLAVAGGVNAIVGPEHTVWMAMLQALSPDGRCKTFDERADGYVRSEGCGMIVLKRLSDAVRDGDRVYAVIRGTAVNHDGASSGLTVPNGLAQQQVIRSALADAGVAPSSIGLVECHGTGTRVGDPIEVRALGAVLCKDRPADQPLFLGAVKANLGHLEAGAGIAGLLRAVLAIRHAKVPPIAHLNRPNPALPLGEYPAMQLPTSVVPWPSDGPRRAGVSSFGISGTNAHVILEQAPEPAPIDRTTPRPATVVTLTGRTPEAVQALARALAERPAALADVAFTQNTGRAQLRTRAAVVASTEAELRQGLARVASGATPSTTAGDRPRVVFLCTGAGPQAVGMARALYDADPTFRAALDAAARAADPVLDRPLLDVIYAADAASSPLHDLAYTQPAMFAIEWAMAALWAEWGVRPDAVIGHSTGQYVAACLAGVFDLEAGMRLMAERARLMSDEPKIGEMVACFASEDRIAAYLRGHEHEVGLAAINGPAEAVISGRKTVVDLIAGRIEADGIEVRRLNISHAAHSPLMDPILDRFEARVAATAMSGPAVPLFENVHGRMAGAEITTPAYWREHMRAPVRFYAGMRSLVDQGYRVFLEIGNHPTLAGAGARCVEDLDEPAVFLPSLRRDRPDWEQLLETVGRLHGLGVAIDFRGFHLRAPGARVALPGTPFVRRRHWVERVDRRPEPTAGAGWTYAERWVAVRPNVDAFGARGDRPLLVFTDATGVGEGLAKRQSRPVVLVRPGAGYSCAEGRATVNPFDRGDHARLLAEVGPAHVVHLWALDTSDEGSPTDAALPAVVSATHTLQVAAGAAVWLVTRGACGVHPGESPNVRQAPMTGLGNTAAIELADTPVVRIDLDPSDADPVLHLELALNTGLVEDQLAVRAGKHYARRLARVPSTGSAELQITDGTYLVTGGLGALGRRIGEWLVAQGAGAVVLTSRRPVEPSVLGFEPSERRVVICGDVSDPSDLRSVLDEIARRGLPPVVGVFHAAGLLDDDWIGNLDRDRFEPVWRPKLDGAWNLARALPDVGLFVLFSSAASLLGNPGQASYGSANAFLDAIARERRAAGKHAVSVCWGPWADGGLATDGTSRQWEKSGVRPMSPAQALAVLGQVARGPEAVIGVVDLDWKRFPAAIPRIPAAFADLWIRPAESVAIADDAPAARRTVVDELAALPSAKRRERLAAVVVAEVAAILGAEVSEVDRKLGFFDAGMDSLMAVELSNRLKARLGRSLPATLAFDFPNVDGLSDHLLGRLALTEAPAPTAAPAAAPPPVALDAPIAVVGLSCRMPGGANDPESFWELLRSGRDPMRDVPPERWDLSEFYDPTPGTPGKMYTRQAGWIDTEVVEGFDPEFFGISGREAESLDPQQRMLLEVAYEALERAGLTTERLYHSKTGVFVGVGSSGYHQRFQQPGGPLYVDQYAGTGALEAFVSGRVAYVLGLHGPNLAVNTACSSALVALHLACQALRTGDAEVALSGGVHLMLSPENFVYVSQLKAVSADGRCKTFDASANGYGRAEGCGVLVLKRLADAERDGDPVLAVIRGTAIGHDGPSSGLTVPYGPAQVQVLSEAVARSGLHPHDVSYVEAHGTGTVLGDPIEVHAIEDVYCRGRTADNPLHLGAVKSNIGHCEVGAGAASMVKMVLALQRAEIPPHLHFREPNPDLELGRNALQVDSAPTPWRSPRGPLRAGVSAFGLAGTNVHVVLEQAPARPADPPAPTDDRPIHWLPLSARSDGALRELALRYADTLDRSPLADVAFSAATTRIPYEQRLTVTAPDAETAAARLRQWASTGEAPFVVTRTAPGRPPKVAFLFSGQGSQYAGMAAELDATWPVFRASIDRCAAVLDPLLGRPLREVLASEDVHDTTYTQPALFALEVSLAALWRSFGVEPAVLLGHSIGQLAAAAVAGVFSLEDGLRLVAERGRLMGALPREGAMLAVFADEVTAREVVAPHGAALGLAAVNNPGEVTVSGRAEAIDAVESALRAKGIESRRLTVSHAFHSPLMDPMLDAFEAVARTVTYAPARLPVVCNLTGALATDAQLSDPAYWRDLVRSAVRFADGLTTAHEEGAEVFVEIGPHTALLGMGRRTLPHRALGWYPSLQRGEPAHERLVPSVGAVWTHGVPVAFAGSAERVGFDGGWRRARLPLPTYPWQRRRVWLDLEEFPGRKALAGQWLVESRWEPRSPTGGHEVGSYVVVGAGPEAERVRAALAARGDRILGDDPLAEGADAVIVAPGIPGDGLGADPTGPAAVVLAVAQKLVGRKVSLTVVTRGAVAVEGPLTHPLAATLWGLVRVVRAEHPELRAMVVDLDDSDAGLLDAVVAADREPECAVRGGVRYVHRLVRGAFTQSGPPALDDGAILVTGGLGGLGLAAARWLVDHGARHLVLVGRSVPTAEAEAALLELRTRGVEIAVERGDVADESDVERIVAAITARGQPLLGVIHAAGVLADAAIPRLDPAALRATFGPKVRGSWNLHLATSHLPLRFFVLFAAGAGLMGAPGQGNYAAANAFEDALAHWRRSRGLPAVAIDWGTWAEVGMAARAGDKLAARQSEEGMRRLPLSAGLDAMGRLLQHGHAQVGVLNVDWDKLVATVHRGVRPPLLEQLVTARAPVAGPAASAVVDGLPPLVAALRGRTRAEWDPIVEGFVEERAARILRLPAGRAIDRGTPLLDLGLDSLLAVELRNAITDGGVEIAVGRVMTGPSVRQIGQMVLTALDEQGPPEAGPVAEAAAAELTAAPPIDPIVSHALAMVLAVVLVIGAYFSRALWERQTTIPVEQDGIEAPDAPPQPGKKGKKAPR